MRIPILVQDLQVGQKWSGKEVISVDAKPESATVIFWLDGESEARCFFKGTEILVEVNPRLVNEIAVGNFLKGASDVKRI